MLTLMRMLVCLILLHCAPASADVFRLTVNATPADARVRIMNIKPKYFDGIALAKGKYEVRVDADGYQTEDRTILLTRNKSIHFYLKSTSPRGTTAQARTSLAKRVPKTSSGIVSKNKTLVVRDDSQGILKPMWNKVVPNDRRRSPGVVMPEAFLNEGFGYAATLLERQKIYKASKRFGKILDTLNSGRRVIILHYAKYNKVYVMYRRDNGSIAYGWIVHFFSANSIPLKNYGSIHPAYFESALDGYFEKVRPRTLITKGISFRPKRGVSVNHEKGERIQVFMSHPEWNNALIMSHSKWGAFPKWVPITDFYSSTKEAIQQLYEPRIALFKLMVVLVIGYTFVTLIFSGGREFLGAMSEVFMKKANYALWLVISSTSFTVFVYGTKNILSIDAREHVFTLVGNPTFYLWFCIPFFLLLPMYVYSAHQFLKTTSFKSDIDANTDVTTQRSQAQRQNRVIASTLGKPDHTMNIIQTKAETERMKYAADALNSQAKAYDELLSKAKKQRQAVVEKEHENSGR